MISSAAAACAPAIARVARPPVRAGIGRARHPARVADDHGPAVAGARLPRPAADETSRRSLIGSSPGAAATGHDRVAGDREEQRGQQRRPRHDRVDLEVLRRRVIVAADRAQAVERRARPGPRSCSRPTRRRWRSRPARSRAARPGPRACSTSRPDRSSFSIGQCAADLLDGDRRVRHRGRRGDRRGPRPRPPRGPPRPVARTSTSRPASSATTFGRVPPCDHADVARSPPASGRSGPGARWSDAPPRARRCDPSPARRRRGRPGRGRQAQVDRPLARRHDVAVRPGAFEDEADVASRASSRMCGRRARRADLLVRVGHEHEPLERQVGGLLVVVGPERTQRQQRVEPGQQPATSCRSRRGRGRSRPRSGTAARAAVPSGKTVSRWPISRIARSTRLRR